MHFDVFIALAGLIVGFAVGLTGMGGGALMTPILVLLFNVAAPAAIASDLVVSFVMKPVGSVVHLRRGTVNRDLVRWLVLGSLPTAFAGVFLINSFGDAKQVAADTKVLLGAALVLAAATMVGKAFVQLRGYKRDREALAAGRPLAAQPVLRVRAVPTLLIGAVGGLMVGMTSVGSGSLIIVALMLVYPALRANDLVGTDLVGTIPLVGAAALGHVLYGDFTIGLTASLLVGSIPGCYLGARVSSAAPGGLVRRALVVVLTASGLKLLGTSDAGLGIALAAGAVAGPLAWMVVRRVNGFPWRYRPGSEYLTDEARASAA